MSSQTLKELAILRATLANTFGVTLFLVVLTQGWGNPGLQLANAFGVLE
jgi:hypothetical protein